MTFLIYWNPTINLVTYQLYSEHLLVSQSACIVIRVERLFHRPTSHYRFAIPTAAFASQLILAVLLEALHLCYEHKMSKINDTNIYSSLAALWRL